MRGLAERISNVRDNGQKNDDDGVNGFSFQLLADDWADGIKPQFYKRSVLGLDFKIFRQIFQTLSGGGNGHIFHTFAFNAQDLRVNLDALPLKVWVFNLFYFLQQFLMLLLSQRSCSNQQIRFANWLKS